MCRKMRNLNAVKWLAFMIITLFLTDIIILLNIPFLRETAAFLFFTIIPGMLIIQILKLNKIKFIKKFILSIGLSISFLLFMGLFLNSLYPFLLKPLSFINVLISSNIFLIVLSFMAYRRNKDDFDIKNIFNFKINLKDKLTFPLILPVLFPFLMVLGTYFGNTTENNALILITLFLIPVYILLIVYLKERVHEATYPISIWMIGMTLLLMAGLSSNHLMGRDVHTEYLSFQLTLSAFHWNVLSVSHPINACLSVTVLPTIYEVLSNINGEYIFKLFFALIGSIIPLAIYVFSEKYVDKKYAFFASLLFIFQAFFIASLGSVRQLIAMFFFFLAVFVLFDTEMDNLSKKILFLILIFSTVLSHYTTAYVAFALIVPILFLPFLKSIYNKLSKYGEIKFTNFDVIIIFFAFVLLWYIVVAKIQLNAGANVIATVSSSGDSGSVLAQGTTDSMVLNIFGIGLTSVPNAISAFVSDAVFLTIFLGLLTLIWRYKSFKKKIGTGYILGVFISIVLLILVVIVPNLSIHYGAERVFIQTLAFLALVFVIGGIKIAKIIKKPKMDLLILSILLISLFTCNTYLQYHFYGIQQSPYYENNGTIKNEYYIYDQEIAAAKWLNNYEINDLKIYSDAIAGSRFLLGYEPNVPKFYQLKNGTMNGYVYLGYVNLNKNIIYKSYTTLQNTTDYNFILTGKDRIYDNSGAQILI